MHEGKVVVHNLGNQTGVETAEKIAKEQNAGIIMFQEVERGSVDRIFEIYGGRMYRVIFGVEGTGSKTGNPGSALVTMVNKDMYECDQVDVVGLPGEMCKVAKQPMSFNKPAAATADNKHKIIKKAVVWSLLADNDEEEVSFLSKKVLKARISRCKE